MSRDHLCAQPFPRVLAGSRDLITNTFSRFAVNLIVEAYCVCAYIRLTRYASALPYANQVLKRLELCDCSTTLFIRFCCY